MKKIVSFFLITLATVALPVSSQTIEKGRSTDTLQSIDLLGNIPKIMIYDPIKKDNKNFIDLTDSISEIYVIKRLGHEDYFYNYKRITDYELVQLLNTRPKSARIYNRSLLYGKIANSLQYGVVLSAWLVLDHYLQYEEYWKTAGYLGGYCLLAIIPFKIMEHQSFKKAINVFNQTRHTKTPFLSLEMGLTNNGAGLIVRF